MLLSVGTISGTIVAHHIGKIKFKRGKNKPPNRDMTCSIPITYVRLRREQLSGKLPKSLRDDSLSERKEEDMNRYIFVIDDDQQMQELLQDLLEEEGYEVDTANNGLDALERLDYQLHSYDVILLDLTMPKMDGLQFLQTIHERARATFSSVIAMSADDCALQQAVHMGVGHALSKPFDLEALLALVPCPAA
jgi:CheY-like chemotaxis protein